MPLRRSLSEQLNFDRTSPMATRLQMHAVERQVSQFGLLAYAYLPNEIVCCTGANAPFNLGDPTKGISTDHWGPQQYFDCDS